MFVILVQFVSWVKGLLWFMGLLDWSNYLHQRTVLADCEQTHGNIYKKKTQPHEREMNDCLLKVGLFQCNISNIYVQLLWGALPGTGSFVIGSNIIRIPPSLVLKYAFCRTVNSKYRIDIYIWWHKRGNIFEPKKKMILFGNVVFLDHFLAGHDLLK